MRERISSETWELTACLAGIAWTLLHFLAGYYNLAYGIDKGYGHRFVWQCYALTACYALAVLTVDAVMIWGKRPCRGAQVYWMASTVCCGLVPAMGQLEGIPVNPLFPLVVTPLLPLLPWVDGILENLSASVLMGGVSLLHWLLCVYIVEKERQHGPVDPGAGTVE